MQIRRRSREIALSVDLMHNINGLLLDLGKEFHVH